MALVNGHALTAKALRATGVDSRFYLVGGPINDVLRYCRKEGMCTIDVHHEQGVALMAHASSRVSGQPGICTARW